MSSESKFSGGDAIGEVVSVGRRPALVGSVQFRDAASGVVFVAPLDDVLHLGVGVSQKRLTGKQLKRIARWIAKGESRVDACKKELPGYADASREERDKMTERVRSALAQQARRAEKAKLSSSVPAASSSA
jgi:hypothetical protein